MENSSSEKNPGLPLSRRLKRALLIALIMCLWSPFKIIWEQDIAKEQDFLRYRGTPMTRQLRDELGQGLTIGVLSGMRSVVADLVWFNVINAWMHQEYFRMGGYINLCTALQPRSTLFWEMGGWELAWNASVDALGDPRPEGPTLRQLKAARFWIDRGLDVYKRGIENNPQYWRLWLDTGMLYDQRLKDYPNAAYYYGKAGDLPDAPIYLERFPAIMYDRQHAQKPEIAYAYWKALWERLTPEQRKMKLHEGDRIETEIRQLEQKLSIPKEKRVFPN